MGKAVKILLTIAMLIGIGSMVLGIISAREEGLSVLEISEILQRNMKELNISPVYREYSDIRETLPIAEGDSSDLVITNTFPDLSLEYGEDMAVELRGDVSTRLDQLVSWQRDGDTLYIDFASVFNENPTSTGLQAVLTLPRELDSLKVTSISGDVTVLGITSRRMDIEVKSGNISLLDSEAEFLRAISQSGNMFLNTSTIPAVSLQTVSGNIDLEAEGLAGSIESTSGNLHARISTMVGDVSLITESGNISLIHEGEDYGYDLTSGSGKVSAVNFGGERQSLVGSNGEPLHLLRVLTGSGNITFEEAP